MIYYLIAEKNEDAICLVKNTNEQTFRQKWGDKIVFRSVHIVELLPKISLNATGKYMFSLN
jgi:hypothetical protein